METKKNPSKDLGLQRNKFFLIGLATSIAIVITAFEWRTVKKTQIPRSYSNPESEIMLAVPITTIDPPLAPQPIQKQVAVKVNPISIGTIVEIGNDKPETQLTTLIELGSIETLPSVTAFPEVPEDETEIFFIVEKDPEPKDGFENFYELLSKNLKYPRQAKQMGTEGKVFVEFIVNKNGEPSDFKIIKGIGSGCDEEAMRVLAVSKWEPGKQRGRPVRVKMVMPISFVLDR